MSRNGSAGRVRQVWEEYTTAAGNSPVGDFIERLSSTEAARVLAAMEDVAELGKSAAKHLRGEVYEVRADGKEGTYRVLFASVGKRKQVLLSLVAFKKKTQKTPPKLIRLSEKRLKDWRRRNS